MFVCMCVFACVRMCVEEEQETAHPSRLVCLMSLEFLFYFSPTNRNPCCDIALASVSLLWPG